MREPGARDNQPLLQQPVKPTSCRGTKKKASARRNGDNHPSNDDFNFPDDNTRTPTDHSASYHSASDRSNSGQQPRLDIFQASVNGLTASIPDVHANDAASNLPVSAATYKSVQCISSHSSQSINLPSFVSSNNVSSENSSITGEIQNLTKLFMGEMEKTNMSLDNVGSQFSSFNERI